VPVKSVFEYLGIVGTDFPKDKVLFLAVHPFPIEGIQVLMGEILMESLVFVCRIFFQKELF
jgi:hypothetical protein